MGVYDPIRGRVVYHMPPGYTRESLRETLDGGMNIEKGLRECGVVASDHPDLVAHIAKQRHELERLRDAGDRRALRKARKQMVVEAEKLVVERRHPDAASYHWKF